MKIQIRTFHYGANHGAFLQAYGLMQACAQFEASYVADYASADAIRAERRVLLNRMRPRVWLRYYQIMRSFARVQSQLRLEPASTSTDAIICGSDEIWNVSNPVTGYDDFYFGASDSSARRIAYAPSVGGATVKDLQAIPGLGEALSQFHALSVRDAHSQKTLEAAFGLQAEIVPDPVFLYDFPEEEPMPEYEGCILVYASSMGNQFAEGLAALKAATGAKIVSLFYPARGADVHLNNVTPFQGLSLFRNARCVVTTTFHGAMLSLRVGTPIMVKLTPEKSHKIIHWLEHFGVMDRVIDQPAELLEIMKQDWDAEQIRSHALDLRKTGLSYLERALT